MVGAQECWIPENRAHQGGTLASLGWEEEVGDGEEARRYVYVYRWYGMLNYEG